MPSKKEKFEKIVSDIKSIKVQGANNVAKAALAAYSLIPTEKSKKILLDSRPTEPMMHKVLQLAKNETQKKILKHFYDSQERINNLVLNLIKKDKIIFTHCHSTTVSKALANAHKKGRKFEVYLTETRPLYQGRRTAKELRKEGIKVTMFVDSSLGIVLSGEQGFKKPDRILIGADAILEKGVINKVGSELLARIANEEKIPFYVVSDSWKFSNKKIPIEQRPLNEVWDKAPRNIRIKNPAFEFVHKKYITGIISELGLEGYGKFLRKISL